MNVDWLREVCLSFPGATEQIQWGSDLLFKVGGKMFAATRLEPASVWLSFKASPENFVELTERANIIPAPYLARARTRINAHCFGPACDFLAAQRWNFSLAERRAACCGESEGAHPARG